MTDGFDYSEVDNYCEFECLNLDDGQLVFEPRETLTEEEKELADIHFGCCVACQIDLELSNLLDQMDEKYSR